MTYWIILWYGWFFSAGLWTFYKTRLLKGEYSLNIHGEEAAAATCFRNEPVMQIGFYLWRRWRLRCTCPETSPYTWLWDNVPHFGRVGTKCGADECDRSDNFSTYTREIADNWVSLMISHTIKFYDGCRREMKILWHLVPFVKPESLLIAGHACGIQGRKKIFYYFIFEFSFGNMNPRTRFQSEHRMGSVSITR